MDKMSNTEKSLVEKEMEKNKITVDDFLSLKNSKNIFYL